MRGTIYIVMGLLTLNIITWIFTTVLLGAIHSKIRESLDLTDTRLLPRPGTGNGVKL